MNVPGLLMLASWRRGWGEFFGGKKGLSLLGSLCVVGGGDLLAFNVLGIDDVDTSLR